MGLLPVIYLGAVCALSGVSVGERNVVHLLLHDVHPPGRGAGESMDRFREADASDAVDVVFLGSSHAYEAFDPRIFSAHGLTSFNLGSMAQTPLNSYFVLERYSRRMRPKLVIMEVYPVALSLDGLESFYDLSENMTFSVEIARMALAIGNPRALTSLISTEFDRRRHPIAEVRSIASPGDLYVHGGYIEWTGRSSFRGHHDNVGELTLDTTQVEYLRRLIALAKRRGADVILVVQPVSNTYRSMITNYWALSESLSRLATESGVMFWDFNGKIDLVDHKHFKDLDHLNAAGVRIFDAALIERMEDVGLLKRPEPPGILPAR